MNRYSHRGSCGCGWRGPWRETSTDAHSDAKKHCLKTGCLLAEKSDDLMPHERKERK